MNLPPRTAALLLTLAGCGPLHTLDSVPVVGGSAAQRRSAESVLSAFDAAVGPGRVTLREIRFVDELGSDARDLSEDDVVAGAYRHASKRILLSSALDPVENNRLRHELCHALDDQEGDLSSAAAEDLESLDAQGLTTYTTDDEWARKEAFALVCELGPEASGWLTDPCPEDGVELAEVMRWMSEEVWSAAEPVPDAPGATEPEVRYVTGVPLSALDDFDLVPMMRDDTEPIFLLATEAAGQASLAAVDPYTGQSSGAEQDAVYTAVPNELDDEPDVALDDVVLEGAHGWADGLALARARVVVPGLGAYERLAVRGADGVWRRVPAGCVHDVRQLTQLDGRVWYAWAEEGAVSWVGYAPE